MQLMATIVAVGGDSLSSGLDWVFFSCRLFFVFLGERWAWRLQFSYCHRSFQDRISFNNWIHEMIALVAEHLYKSKNR